ncbi:hypothetical protein F5Y14DRAFT_424940 [Nemania sp. NC0429]|nr:hypothetical protein F5Y14DRAFT_424940 [Nemania sp. NC0429]
MDVTCVLCGCAIGELQQAPSWMSRFRAVYALDKTSALAHLSGPGERLAYEDTISVTSSGGEEKHIRIELMLHTFGGTRFTLPTEDSEDDEDNPSAWGFPFHCSCWEVLKASSPTNDVHIQSLFDLCRSFPTALGTILDFGHDYGGLFQRQYLGWYPPCPGEETQLRYKNFDDNYSIFQAYLTLDPLDASSLAGSIGDQASSREYLTPRKPTRRTIAAHDPFGNLPLEILHWILTFIPSTDVLNLKLSSRVMANTGLPDRFWHSRFCYGQEFDYMFEFAQYSKYRGRWKKVFLAAQRLPHPPSLVNRKRIWSLATALHDILSRTGSCHGSALRSWFEQDAPLDSRIWVTASRNLKPYQERFSRGSRSLYERFLALPDTLLSISVSVTDSLTGRYVSGIRIKDTNDKGWDLGYFRPRSSSTFTTSRIVGFLLAEDQRGIRGMKVLSESSLASEWIGEHQDVPRRRLTLPKAIGGAEDSVKHIKGGFDACKMVSLAISGQMDSADSSHNLTHTLSHQETAIWFPDIPPSEYSFFGVPGQQEQSDPEQARPLQVGLFSDFTGSHLPHVTGITLWTTSDEGHVLSLRVDLDEPLHGQTKVYLGANQRTLRLIQRDRDVDEHSFAINSADGERIIGLDMNYSCNGGFLGLEVHTNMDRTAELPPTPTIGIRRSDWVTMRLWPEAGHIVGFFGTADSRDGLFNLGIVCGGTAILKQFPSEISRENPCYGMKLNNGD